MNDNKDNSKTNKKYLFCGETFLTIGLVVIRPQLCCGKPSKALAKSEPSKTVVKRPVANRLCGEPSCIL